MNLSIIIIGSIVTLFALFSLLLWIWTTILSFIQAYRHTLQAHSIAIQLPFALSVTWSMLLALTILYPVLLLLPPFAHTWISSLIFNLFGIALGAILLLWVCLLILRFMPINPDYRYFLPRDADLVRQLECQQGIILAARDFPESIDQETLELMTRSVCIRLRQERYPKKKKYAVQLTNDFAIYTKLAIEGLSCGYTSFWKACQEDSNTLDVQRTTMKEKWPEDEEIYKTVEELASSYLDLHRGGNTK